MTAVQIYTADQAAQLLGCSVKTVEEMARQGELPGIKPGGGWVFPAGALALRLDQLAIEQAATRRQRPAHAATTATTVIQPAHPRRSATKLRALPRLIDLR